MSRFTITWDSHEWLRMLMELGVGAITAGQWADAFADEVQPARFTAGILDVQAFVPQFLHETGMLKRLDENMNYSAERIAAVWPGRFPTVADARSYEHRPEELANKVYGGRMGNKYPGDGWAFRGRGAGITGRTNYEWLGDTWGQDLLVSPQLLEQPHYALEGFFFWWEGHVPDKSLSDQSKVRRVVNGGSIGMEHCQQLYDLTCKVTA
jgi:putative chitinase